jgi:hypothetical protein
VVLSSNPLKPRLTTSPFDNVIPSCRHVNVVPSTTARPVVDGTWVAVMVVPPAVKTATTVASAFMDPVNVLGVVAPVWPWSDVEEKFIVVLLAVILSSNQPRLSYSSSTQSASKRIYVWGTAQVLSSYHILSLQPRIRFEA